MNRTEKILTVIGLAVLIIGALVVRQNDAGYLAFLKKDYQKALAEFSKLALEGDPWGTHFTGFLLDPKSNGQNNRSEAAKYYLAGARLGNVRSALRYIDLIRTVKNFKIYCPIYAALVDKAAQTHSPYAFFFKGWHLSHGFCVPKNLIAAARFYQWASEIKPHIGDHFSNAYAQFDDRQKKQFETFKIDKPNRISEQAFLDFFLAKQEQFRLINFD